MKYTVKFSSDFKKDYKKIKKQYNDLTKLNTVIEKLANGEILDARYKDHALINNKYYSNCRECHIEPDWLLVYSYRDNDLILYLVGTGSRSELFK